MNDSEYMKKELEKENIDMLIKLLSMNKNLIESEQLKNILIRLENAWKDFLAYDK